MKYNYIMLYKFNGVLFYVDLADWVLFLLTLSA